MKARYQYRFYPTDQQRTSLAQLFGCVRVVWNDALALCKQSEKLPSNGDLQKLILTQGKKTEQRSWLSSVASIALQQSVADLGIAYKNFFDSLKGKRKGKKLGSPRFKKKTNQQSARLTRGGFSISKETVYLAKIGNVNPIWSRQLPCEPSSVTIIKDCANRYFLSFVIDLPPVSLDTKSQSRRSCVATSGAIGIDLGIKTFAVMSNGEKAESPSYKKLDRKVRKLQKKLARQHKDSKRRDKTRIQIAKRHNQITDTRRDFLHKLSTKIVSENQAIVLEDLNVSSMVKNRKLSRVISLQGWREFRTQCVAKCAKYDRTFHVISRWEPTSQVCSECGFKWGKLDLKVRQIKCLNCATEHDRDGNAAKNIEKVGIGHCHDSKCTSRRSKPTSVVSVNEA